MIKMDLEWQKLCEEHSAARDAYFKAFATVNDKFTKIAKGTSKSSPSTAELDELEAAWNTWQDVRRCMDEFIKKNI
jgi:hypothetical protein